MKQLWLMSVVLVSLAVAGCAKKAPGVDLAAETPRLVLFAQPQELTQVRSAIIAALQARGWTTEGETADTVTARLAHRGNTARIELSYAADRLSIRGLETNTEQRQYDKWLAGLESGIRDGLARPVVAAAAPAFGGGTPPPTLAVFGTQQTAASAKSALQRGLSQHGWVIEEETSPTSLLARLNNRKGLVRVRLDYDTEKVTISYVTSTDLDIEPSGHSDDYEKWMRNLVAAIVGGTKSAVVEPAPAPAPAPAASATPAPVIAIFGVPQTPEKARVALQRALGQHSWVIEDAKGDVFVARLAHRKGLVRVRIESTGERATITYVDSQGLSLSSTGQSADYEKWMRNLVAAIVAATRS